MEFLTYTQIKTKLENDLDLLDEDFVTEEELLGYMNEAIDDAEGIIHTLGLEANYFLTTDTLSLVSGTADYTAPSDIYADKFMKVFYNNGALIYEIFRIRNLNDVPWIQTGEDYRYLILNLTAGIKTRIYPTPQETGAYVQRFYIRNVRKLTSSSSASNTCELPECVNFLFAHVRTKVYEKEGNPNLETARTDLKIQHDLMIQLLQEQVPDGNNQIQPDLSFYEDMCLDYYRWGQ